MTIRKDTPIILNVVEDPQRGHQRALERGTVSAEQICRTCVRDANHTTVDVYAVARVRRQGGDVAAFMAANRCEPTRVDALWRLDDAGVLSRLEPDGSIKVTVGRKPAEPASSVGLIANCGQQIATKCKTCGHFAAQTQTIPATATSWKREVVVGGHCRLGDRCAPTRAPIDTSRTKSCSTCANLMTFTNDWCATHGDPVRIDLTPYERWALTQGVGAESAGLTIWRARQHLGQRQRRDGTFVVYGTVKSFAATATTWRERFGPQGSQIAVALATGAGEVVAPFDLRNDDLRTGIVEVLEGGRVMLSFLTPYQHTYGLGEDRYRRGLYPPPSTECRCIRDTSWWSSARNPRWAAAAAASVAECGKGLPNPKCVECGGVGMVASLPERQAVPTHRPRPPADDCPRCSATRACYYHAKGFAPLLDEQGLRTYGRSVSDAVARELNAGIDPGITTAAGERRAANRATLRQRLRHASGEANPARHLVVHPETGMVTDAADQPPDAVMFMLRLRQLCEDHPQFSIAIHRQARALTRQSWIREQRSTEINPAFAQPLSVQPWVPYCSANLADPTIGVDLRAELGDWWGDPRSNQGTNPSMRYTNNNYFSRKKHAALEEYLRVTNPGERLAEHLASTRRYVTNMAGTDAATPAVDWDSFVPSRWYTYDPLGRESIHPDYNPSTAEYVNWLDTPVEITIANDGDGEHFTATNRWKMHGFENYRGGRQLRAHDVAEVWAQRAAEEMDVDAEFDPEAVYVGFVCLACGATPSVAEAIEADMVCTAADRTNDGVCGGSLGWYEGRGEDAGTDMGAGQIGPDELYRPKAQRVINPDMVVPPDTERWQQTEILMSLGHDCVYWRPRGRRGWSAPMPIPAPTIDRSTWIGRSFRLYLPGGAHSPADTAAHARGAWRDCTSCVVVLEITADNLDEPIVDAIIRSGARATVVYTDRANRPHLASVLDELSDVGADG